MCATTALGVYVISNEGVGNAIKLVGDLHSGQQLVDDDGGNVAAAEQPIEQQGDSADHQRERIIR
ncbi:MAG: hypothetical protein R3C56_30165 [Pirellulaceae bacterium]